MIHLVITVAVPPVSTCFRRQTGSEMATAITVWNQKTTCLLDQNVRHIRITSHYENARTACLIAGKTNGTGSVSSRELNRTDRVDPATGPMAPAAVPRTHQQGTFSFSAKITSKIHGSTKEDVPTTLTTAVSIRCNFPRSNVFN